VRSAYEEEHSPGTIMHAGCQTHDGWEHGNLKTARRGGDEPSPYLMGDIVRSVFEATIIEK
jgi:hypothetical protein